MSEPTLPLTIIVPVLISYAATIVAISLALFFEDILLISSITRLFAAINNFSFSNIGFIAVIVS